MLAANKPASRLPAIHPADTAAAIAGPQRRPGNREARTTDGRRFGLAPLCWLVLLTLLGAVILPVPVRGAEAPVTLHFQGNQALSAERLQEAAAEELGLFARLGRPTAIDDAAYLMQLAYRRHGYHFATVDYEIQASPAETRVAFLINEGGLVRLGKITFHGNTVFSDQELNALVTDIMRGEATGPPPFIESRLNEALGRIRELYLNEGYRNVRIEAGEILFSPQSAAPVPIPPPTMTGPLQATAAISIDEGWRWLIIGVELDQPPPAAAAATVARALREAEAELVGQPYFTRRKLVLRSHLLEALQETGFPEAQVQIDDQTGAAPGEIILRAAMDSGPRVLIAEIEISGNQRTSSSFINRRLKLTPGDIYRDRQRRNSFRELYGSGLFSRVSFELEPLDPEVAERPEPLAESVAAALADHPDPVIPHRLLVEVEETTSRELFLAGGWGSYELLRLRAGFTDRNLFGHGRIFRFETGGSTKGAEVQAGITDHWLFETPTQAEIPVFYRIRKEPSFTRTEFGVGLNFSRNLPHDLAASLGYQIRRSDISRIEAEADRESLESGYGIASVKFQLSRDTRNDIFFPTAGHRGYGALEVADKSLGGDLGFYRFTGGWRQFRAISPALTVGLRADTGLVLPGRDQLTIPLGERFYSGGGNSVRSFREGQLGPKDLNGQPVGGMAFNTLSVELRRRLGNKLALSVFVDYGNIAPNLSRAEEGRDAAVTRSEVISDTLSDYFSDFRPGLGLGLQYLLPVGPARLDFAFNPDRRADRHEPSYVIHFSLGMAF